MKNISKLLMSCLDVLLLLLVFFSASSTVAICLNSNLSFDISSNGFNRIFTLFNFPITLIAASIAIFTLRITLYRTAQFEMQLKLFSNNNLFKNYYSLLRFFIEHFEKQPLFELLKKRRNIDQRFNLIAMYKYYYGDNYRVFSPSLNESYFKSIDSYLSQMLEIGFGKENYDLMKIPIQDLERLSEFNNEILVELTHLFDGYIRENWSEVKRKQVFLIAEAYWSSQFYLDFLKFNGELADKDFDENVAINMNEFCNSVARYWNP